jgi:acylphosphatase
VEAVFGGDEAAVDEMVVACGKGPPLARVTGVVTEPCEPPDVGFATRPTE